MQANGPGGEDPSLHLPSSPWFSPSMGMQMKIWDISHRSCLEIHFWSLPASIQLPHQWGCGCTGSAEKGWVLVLVFLGSGSDLSSTLVFLWLLCRPWNVKGRALDVRGGSSSPAVLYPTAGQGIPTEMNDVWVEASWHTWEEENQA